MEFPATFTDQMGNQIVLNSSPQRIISLVPSQTELLADLGLGDKVVGITKFCVHPESWFRSKTRIGGTKNFDFDKIRQLQPDLIIGNKEENEQEQIRELQQKYPVWMSVIRDLNEAMTMIRSIGQITERLPEVNFIENAILGKFGQLAADVSNRKSFSVAYLIWRNPYMAAGPGTFINSMLEKLHLKNVLTKSRYPETTLEELSELSPEIILLSSEPYPFGEKHVAEIQSALPKCRILLVDGEMFSWYGSRLLLAPGYFRKVLQEIH